MATDKRGCKLVRELSKRLPGQELNAQRTNGGHFKVWVTGCRFVTVSASPSDHHALRNIIGDLRRSLNV